MLKRIPILIALLAAGCSYAPTMGLSPHRIDIQQGNYVTQEMVSKLQPGMTKSQVRFALGTPLIADAFHPDRWDYVFVQQKQGRITQQRRVVVVFEGDKLVRIEGDVAPTRDVAQDTPK
jgi:outer membrane protein assembly factor BamE